MTADEWWDQRLTELKAQYGDDLWKMPRGVMADARREHADRLRAEWGRNPDTGEKTPQRVKDDRPATEQELLDLLKGVNNG